MENSVELEFELRPVEPPECFAQAAAITAIDLRKPAFDEHHPLIIIAIQLKRRER
jgi:hypothetical protein